MSELNGLTASWEMVTPALAQDWLARGKANRVIRRGKVDQYKRDMAAGQWWPSTDAIGFLNDGTEINGQHRLKALVACGKPQLMLIVRGLPPESSPVIDGGILRKFGDFLTIERSEANGRSLAAVITFMLRYRHYGRFAVAHGTLWSPSRAELLDLFDSDVDRFRLASKSSGKWAKGFPVPPSILGGLWMIFSEIDPDEADVFFDRLASGVELPAKSPLLLLRKQVFDWKARSQRMLDDKLIALIVKTWNAYRKGNNLGVLKWNPSIEPMPTPA